MSKTRFLALSTVVLFALVLAAGAFLFLRPSVTILPVGPDGEAWDAEGATVSFAMGDEIRFLVMEGGWGAGIEKREVRIGERAGEEVEAEIEMREQGFARAVWEVRLSPDAFPPFERFTLEVEGVALRFTRGALAVNTERDTYRPFEKVAFGFVVADEEGKPVCDAAAALVMEDPGGRSVARTTDDEGVYRNPQCGLHAVSDDPDYAVDIALGDTSVQGQVEYQREARRQLGTHQVTVRAEAAGEQIATRTVFPVRDDASFVIARKGPVRLVAGATYRMEIAVTTVEEFSGTLVEQLPEDFLVSNVGASAPQPRETQTQSPPPSGAPTVSRGRGASAEVSWDVELAQGETARFFYEFVAPPDQPAVWGLTPLRLGEEEEARAWEGIVEPAPYALEIPDPAIIQFGDPAAPTFWERGNRAGSDPATAARVRIFWEGTLRYKETRTLVEEVSDTYAWSWTHGDGTVEAKGEIPGAKALVRYRISPAGQILTSLRVESSAENPIEDIDLRLMVERASEASQTTASLFLVPAAASQGSEMEPTEKGAIVHFPVGTMETGETVEVGLTLW